MQEILGEEKLQVADVGATGGPEERWKKWTDAVFFHTFDPDPRAKPWDIPSKNHPTGLWSSKCRKTLKLAAYPPATSLYSMNRAETDAFLHHKALHCVGETEIELDTLDHSLQGQKIDFLKIDAEGAEFEILKGGNETLKSCLGFQVEVKRAG